jgi:inorganic pyrophosphatase
MTDLLTLPTFAPGTTVHVVAETPRHSRAKFKYDPKLRAFTLSRALTLGLIYPYDWGFVPSTAAPDGDPIDALVLHNVTTSPGMVLRCKPLGILDVLQTEKQRTERNDHDGRAEVDFPAQRPRRSRPVRVAAAPG